MDIETVAELLDVSTRQIRTYVTAGMPAGRDGRKPVFNWREVLDWYVGYRSSLEYGERPLAAADDADPDDEPLAEDDATPGRKEDIRSASLRKIRAEADLKELALSRERREVVTIADARASLDRLFGNLRTQLLGIAPRLASLVVGVKVPAEIESLVQAEMESLCRELSTGKIVGVSDSTLELADDSEPHGAMIEDIEASAETGLSDRQLRRAAQRLERLYAAE